MLKQEAAQIITVDISTNFAQLMTRVVVSSLCGHWQFANQLGAHIIYFLLLSFWCQFPAQKSFHLSWFTLAWLLT